MKNSNVNQLPMLKIMYSLICDCNLFEYILLNKLQYISDDYHVSKIGQKFDLFVTKFQKLMYDIKCKQIGNQGTNKFYNDPYY